MITQHSLTPTQEKLLRSAFGGVRVSPQGEAEWQSASQLADDGLLVAAGSDYFGGYAITGRGIQALEEVNNHDYQSTASRN